MQFKMLFGGSSPKKQFTFVSFVFFFFVLSLRFLISFVLFSCFCFCLFFLLLLSCLSLNVVADPVLNRTKGKLSLRARSDSLQLDPKWLEPLPPVSVSHSISPYVYVLFSSFVSAYVSYCHYYPSSSASVAFVIRLF